MKYEKEVHELLRKIPKGKVTTYGDLAEALGNRKIARVVGNILHVNKDPNGIPCYKVVNSEGKLSKAYAYGGIEAQKKRLEDDGIPVKEDTVDLLKYRCRFGKEPFMIEEFLKEHHNDIAYLDGLFGMASLTSAYIGRDEVVAYVLPKEDTPEVFRNFFKLRVTLTKEPLKDMKEVFREWFGAEGTDLKIVENLCWLLERRYGKPKEVYTVKEFSKAIERLDGPKGYGPFFFHSDFFFAEFETFTACFFMGNNE